MVTYSAGGDVVELGGGNGGQGDDGGEGEGLHFGVGMLLKGRETKIGWFSDGMLKEVQTKMQRFIHQYDMRLP